MSDNKPLDVRASLSGWAPNDGFTIKKSRRRACTPVDEQKVVKYDAPLRLSNPLPPHEQKNQVKALLAAQPTRMVYLPFDKDRDSTSIANMFNNALQQDLVSHEQIMAVISHQIAVLSQDHNPEIRSEVEAIRLSTDTIDTLGGDYDSKIVSWFCDEIFYKGSLREVDITKKEEFVELYSKYFNGVTACHYTHHHRIYAALLLHCVCLP